MKEATLTDLKIEYLHRKFEEDCPIWKTRTGRPIPVTKMTDTHLKNTILMLERNLEEEEIALENSDILDIDYNE